MTNEEAIEILKLYKHRLEESVSTELGNDIQAFEMAISALENNYNSAEQTGGDLISRDYTIQQIQKAKESNYNFNYNTLIDFIKVLPSAEKTAEWIFEFSRGKDKYYQCSICGKRVLTDNDVVKDFPYCHCGAKMEGGKPG